AKVVLGCGLKPSPQTGGSEQDGSKEVSGGFVVARCDAAEMLQLVKEALDQVALPIDQVVDWAWDLAVTGGRDVRPSATRFDKIDDSAGVIAPVSDEVSIRFEPFDQ